MFGIFGKEIKGPGLPPGALVYTGEKSKTDAVEISIWDYDIKGYREFENVPVERCKDFKNASTVTWINVNGVHDPNIIQTLGEIFDIHSLVLEDLLNPGHRAKFEAFDNYLFIITKMLHQDQENHLKAEQVGLIVGPGYVLSFQEFSGDVFNPVRQRIRNGKGNLRKMGSDYLAYALIDTLVDHAFIMVDRLGEQIEALEEDLIEGRTGPQDPMKVINSFKKTVVFLRRTIWPFRDLISDLQKDESNIFKKKTKLFLRDVYDHVIQLTDFMEVFRDLLSDLTDLHLSALSNRLNEVMKFLTIIGTIFIPLTFLAGIYGMNFKHMPELEWPLGYPVLLVTMVAIGLTLVFYFKKKGWL